jgi:hypothetical protein
MCSAAIQTKGLHASLTSVGAAIGKKPALFLPLLDMNGMGREVIRSRGPAATPSGPSLFHVSGIAGIRAKGRKKK